MDGLDAAENVYGGLGLLGVVGVDAGEHRQHQKQQGGEHLVWVG